MSTLLAILQIIPALIKVIFAVEEAMPQSGVGKEKLGMVRGMMEASYSGIAEMWPAIEKIVSIVIGTMNTINAKK